MSFLNWLCHLQCLLQQVVCCLIKGTKYCFLVNWFGSIFSEIPTDIKLIGGKMFLDPKHHNGCIFSTYKLYLKASLTWLQKESQSSQAHHHHLEVITIHWKHLKNLPLNKHANTCINLLNMDSRNAFTVWISTKISCSISDNMVCYNQLQLFIVIHLTFQYKKNKIQKNLH